MVLFDTILEPFQGLLLTLKYLNLFPPTLLALLVKGDQEHLFYNVTVAEITYLKQQILNVYQ